MARENQKWGYTRIQGEILKLDRTVGRSTVRRILQDEGIPVAPNRSDETWKEFLKRHQETLWACDFSCVPSISFRGIKMIYFLIFIQIGSSRVFFTGCTENPHAAWGEQQARNFSIYLGETNQRVQYVLHDRDRKFTKKFQDILRTSDAKPVKLPVRAPNLNGFVESWIGSLKRECSNHFIIFGQRHLHYLIRGYVAHYHRERPHQSLGNQTVIPLPNKTDGDIACKSRLGGLLKHYYREAA